MSHKQTRFECVLPKKVKDELVSLFQMYDIGSNLVVPRLKLVETIKKDTYFASFFDTVVAVHEETQQTFTVLNVLNVIEVEYLLFQSKNRESEVKMISQAQLLGYFMDFSQKHIDVLTEFEEVMGADIGEEEEEEERPGSIEENPLEGLAIEEDDLVLLQDMFDALPRAGGKYSVNTRKYVEQCLLDPEVSKILTHPARNLFMGEKETIRRFLNSLEGKAPNTITWNFIMDALKSEKNRKNYRYSLL
jgi:hypothetical protein